MFLGRLSETVEFSAEKNPSSFGTGKIGLKKSVPKSVHPQIRPFESDAATSAGTLEASKPHLKGHGDPGCPEHCPQWFCDCASKLGDGE